MSWKAHIIGIGMGAYRQLTAEAVEAIKSCDLFLVADKGKTTAQLVDARAELVKEVRGNNGYRFVAVADPERNSDGDPDPQSYRAGVASWRQARAMANVAEMEKLGTSGVVGFLAWGDPAFFDSTIKMVSDIAQVIPLEYDVIPGLSAFQILAAEAKIGLNGIGSAVHITPGRRLVEEWSPKLGTVVVMLDGYLQAELLAKQYPDITIVWGAYLGLPQQTVIQGKLGQVIIQIKAVRADLKAKYGWVMDTYALLPPTKL